MVTPEQAMKVAYHYLNHAIKLEQEGKPVKFVELRLKMACEAELMALGFMPINISPAKIKEYNLD